MAKAKDPGAGHYAKVLLLGITGVVGGLAALLWLSNLSDKIVSGRGK